MTAPVDHRERLPRDRPAIVHNFDVAGHEGTIRVGLYADGRVGEIFVKMSKAGSLLSGLMDAYATAISLLLQNGVPLESLAEKFIGARFDPCGITPNPNIPETSSIIDYLFRYLLGRFGPEARAELTRALRARPLEVE